jgi:hypothetical protein
MPRKPDSKLPTTEKDVALAIRLFLVLLAFLCFSLAAVHASTVYITADNLEGTNLFGTLDVATGQFSRLPLRILFFLR